ncbi:TPA: DNA-directed RNA polymerase subunit A'' [archaeon]|jgi:DNA-directed RNA polymerase subunit A"|uniref:DNA-directed RNA polymerase n=1 Tax=Candidatus Undinarchaeum marinum TaxID=2756141 RepID=A0A832XL83_9ARCH|nr:DNA-directed RNA polymerase subunit A'' [Candidatus Undinarchaeum marinum]
MSESSKSSEEAVSLLPPKLRKEAEEFASKIKSRKQSEDFLNLVTSTYLKAKVEPGEGVGVVAAQSLGEPGTQMMMRTKHYAGTAMDVTRGLPRLIEIFDARRTPKTPMMEIYLDKANNTIENAESIAHRLKETRIKNIMTEMSTDFAKYSVTVTLDRNELKKRNITPKKLENTLIEIYGNRVSVEGGNKAVIKTEKKVASLLQKLKEDLRETHLSGIGGISYVVVQKKDRDFILYTSGTNLKDILLVPGVDASRTKSNDILEVEKVFGIEAARNMLVEETILTLDDAGLSVDNRHITLVSDTMCADGRVKAVGRHGISGDKASILARASFEETVKHLLRAAAYNESDPLNGVVENIIVGQVINLGTGVPELIMKKVDKK